MSISLPKPIAHYFASDNAGDVDALADCVAADAIVRDERRTFQGLPAIKAWRAESRAKYAHTVRPVAAVERDGATVVTGMVSGNFPGSPVNLEFVFVLSGDKIASLEIR